MPQMIVMGLDQHRAQVTAEWLDTATGEVSRARVAPAHRESVRRFFGRFAGQELEVALEATTDGASWSSSCAQSARMRTWPSRLRPPSGAGARSVRRPIVPTPGYRVSC
jgi:hypothetical protein